MMKKNSCGSKIPLPPHNFSNGPSLNPLNGNGDQHHISPYEVTAQSTIKVARVKKVVNK